MLLLKVNLIDPYRLKWLKCHLDNKMLSPRSHLVWLRRLVQHPGINGRCRQVIGSCDGVNVAGQMKVKLYRKTQIIKDERVTDETSTCYCRNVRCRIERVAPVDTKPLKMGVNGLHSQHLMADDKCGFEQSNLPMAWILFHESLKILWHLLTVWNEPFDL